MLKKLINDGLDVTANVSRFEGNVLYPFVSALKALNDIGYMESNNCELIDEARNLLLFALLSEASSVLDNWEESLLPDLCGLIPADEENNEES